MSQSNLGPYLSPQQREARLDVLARTCSGDIVTYGHSVEGRPLRALRIPSQSSEPVSVLCSANIHGPEYIGVMVALRVAEAFVSAEPWASPLRARAEVWVIPSLNPDAYARTWASAGAGSLAELRTNARGVDLNRNFPIPHGRRLALPGAGSVRPGNATYVGTKPLSEPETSALEAFLRARAFRASANLHSFMGTLIPAHVSSRSEYSQYRRLCRRFASAQSHRRYRRLSARIFDGFTGEMEDHQHHALGTWAVCVEVFTLWASMAQHWRAPKLFWRFNPRDPHPWMESDSRGIVAFLSAAIELEPPQGISS
jgi:predicted deacylase